MALIIVESFDGVGAASGLEGKWTAVAGMTQVAGRYGNGLHPGGGSASLRYAIPTADQDDLLIVGAAVYMSVLTSTRAVFRLGADVNATTHITVNINTNGQVEVRLGTGSGGTVIASTPNNTIQAATWHYLEVKVRLSDSTSDLVVRVDGVQQTLSPAGPYDTKNAGTATVFDNVDFGAVLSGFGASDNPDYDDIYVLNEQTTDAFGNTSDLIDFLGDCRVEALQPNGNGTSSQFDGSDGNSTDNYLLVDEVTADDDTTYVQTNVADEKDTYAYDNLATTSGGVAAVQIVTRARKTDVGTRQSANVSRAGGTEQDSANFTLATSYGTQRSVHEKKPSAAGWTRTDVDAAEFGVKAK